MKEAVAGVDLVGRSTVECIQSGLYFGNRAAIAGLTQEIRQRLFQEEPVLVIATGGFCRLFEGEQLFDVVLHDLVLLGRGTQTVQPAGHTSLR